jgi:hypothetical protein
MEQTRTPGFCRSSFFGFTINSLSWHRLYKAGALKIFGDILMPNPEDD